MLFLVYAIRRGKSLQSESPFFFNNHELGNPTAYPIFNFQCQKNLCNLMSPYLWLLCPCCSMRTIFLRQNQN